MDSEKIKNEIDKLNQFMIEFIEKIKGSQTIIVEDLSGGMKGVISSKFSEIESNAKQLIENLNETKDIIDSTVKKSKKIKKPKIASDVWTMLK